MGKRIQSAKKKSERSKEVHMSIKRSKDSIHIPEKGLKFRSEHSNTRGILNFTAKEIKFIIRYIVIRGDWL